MLTKNNRLTGILLTVAFILLVPFIAIQVTNEVSWTFFDFVAAGILLMGTGLLCELVLRKAKQEQNRALVIVVILVVLLLIWRELAVGIFGISLAGS
ncbi:hypothetical protein WJR50_20015 [Catalinimonas sp. 4WD22]|uniref:hypothetical protein n=1 Tax=Catalinimonas locisalis TaxID=3133978 RepID=UPI0031017C70